jgi:Ca2+-binding RTX toxin-like protein
MAKVYGTNNLDVLDGWFDGVTDGDDTIFGYGGDDWIYGLDGNDILQGGEGADKLFGGNGHDTASYGDSPSGVYVNLLTGQGYHGTAEGDQLYSIENITGSVFNDSLVGNAYDNVLSGGFGDDDLEGRGGADILNGGWGVDTANYSTSPAGVMVSLLWHSASGGDAQGDQLNSIENLIGSWYDDGLFGDNGDNSLAGEGGSDTLLGFGGNDYLMGSSGNDSLNGGAGLDVIYGGDGADTLFGGADADTFLFVTQYESAGWDPSGIDYANTDVILDFNFAEGDKIDVHYVDANVKAPGDQGFNFIGEYNAAGGFTAAGQVAYFYDGSANTYLIFNTDGAFQAGSVPDFEFAIRLVGQYAPEASWFNL